MPKKALIIGGSSAGLTDEQSIPKQEHTRTNDQSLGPFKAYLLGDDLNRALLWIAGITISTQFIIFKTLYPYAGFIDGDSYAYIKSAYLNSDINFYPIGYSKFLRLFSIFTKSDTALVAFQYVSIQATAIWFIFTLFYIYNPGKFTKWAIFSFVVLNPVFLYVSNYVSSDALFLALSVAWFTLLLWTLRQPTPRLITGQLLVLILVFMVRYNALYYPLVATIALVLCRQPLKLKFIGIGGNFLVIGIFMLYTANQYKELTGIREFSPFSGWQIANNAMYAYRYVDSCARKPSPAHLIALDRAVQHYFDTSRNLKEHPVEMLVASTIYMWDPRSPLQQFMKDQFKSDSSAGYLKRWACMAPLYSNYGYYIIKQYPLTYIKYYLWPNVIKFYAPPVEFLDEYNMGCDTVKQIGKEWFGYKTNKVRTVFKDFKISILGFLPILAGIMNVLFLLGLTYVVCFNGYHRQILLLRVLFLAATLWLINFGFSVFASPITLRYQLFGILVFTSFALILTDYMYKTEYGTFA